MKMKNIKFKILNEKRNLFNCNLMRLNFVLNTLLIGQMCKETFHLFSDVSDNVTRSLDVRRESVVYKPF